MTGECRDVLTLNPRLRMKTTNEPIAPISSKAAACLSLFDRCITMAASIDAQRQSSMEDHIARFSIWTSNMAVFAKSKMSLDHRLRWTPQVRDLVTGLLGVLEDCIDEFSALLEKLGSSHLSSPGRNELLASGVFEQALLSISNEITLLNEISNTIRKSNRKTQDAKAMGDFTMKDGDGNDIEKRLYDVWAENILDRFPGCNETIRLRLAWTMVLRRRRIIYRRHRHSGEPFRALQTSDKPSLRSLPGETEGGAHTRRFQRFANQGDSPSVMASTTIRSATTLALPDFQKAQAPSAVSKSRTIALDSHEGLVFPRAPGKLLSGRSKHNEEGPNPDTGRWYFVPEDGLDDTSSPAKVPRTALGSAGAASGEAWRNRAETLSGANGQEADIEEVCPEHVTGDLEAYVCLFEECDEPYQIWTRSESWLKHMKQHSMRWNCPAKSHRGQPFLTQQEFQRHLEKDHNKKYSEAELSLVITRSRRSAGPLFTSCPLCGQEAKEFTKSIEKHIAGHLRSLALKSLPPSYDEKDDEEDDSSDKKSDGAVSNRSTVLGLIDETSTFEAGIEAAQTSAEHHDSIAMVNSDIPLSKQISELLEEDQITLELVSREVFNKIPTRDKLTTNWQIPHHMALVQESDLGNHEDNPFLWLCRSVALNVVRRHTAGDYGGIDDVTHGKLVSLVQQAVQSSYGEKFGPKVPELQTEGASSYWCEFEAMLFPYLLRSFGSEWEAIAAFMGTKTATMVKNYYQRKKDDVDTYNGSWEEIVKEVDKQWAETFLSPSPAEFQNSTNMKRYDTDVSLGSASASPHSSPQVTTKVDDGAPEEEGEGEDKEIVRCICGSEEFPGLTQEAKLHYCVDGIVDADFEGLFVQCDSCQVWQHGGCIGILDEGQSPMEYFCEECRPELHEKHVASDG
ncbi:hypothetical protein ACHAQI_010084 [Fusarium lateritium]